MGRKFWENKAMNNKSNLIYSALGVIALVLLMTYSGCGSATDSAQETSGSSATVVGGSTAQSSVIRLDITSNRSSINVGDQAQITIQASCVAAGGLVGGGCITNSSGDLVFASQPTEFQTGNAAPVTDLVVSNTFTVSKEGTLSTAAIDVTLTGGTRADSTASPVVTVIPGDTASTLFYNVTLTGAQAGSAIITSSVLDVIVTLVVDVLDQASSLIAN